jgi:hypothetical protein
MKLGSEYISGGLCTVKMGLSTCKHVTKQTQLEASTVFWVVTLCILVEMSIHWGLSCSILTNGCAGANSHLLQLSRHD